MPKRDVLHMLGAVPMPPRSLSKPKKRSHGTNILSYKKRHYDFMWRIKNIFYSAGVHKGLEVAIRREREQLLMPLCFFSFSLLSFFLQRMRLLALLSALQAAGAVSERARKQAGSEREKGWPTQWWSTQAKLPLLLLVFGLATDIALELFIWFIALQHTRQTSRLIFFLALALLLQKAHASIRTWKKSLSLYIDVADSFCCGLYFALKHTRPPGWSHPAVTQASYKTFLFGFTTFRCIMCNTS
jgi:hypothetical protein